MPLNVCLYVFQSSGLAKTILQGTVNGDRRRGGKTISKRVQAGMDFASSARAAEDRTRWRGAVAKSSVVPQRPYKLWDRLN